MPTDSPSFRLCNDVRYRQIADEGIVLRQQADEVLVLNEVGARIMALLDDGLTPHEISERLAAEFDAELARIDADVSAFLDDLREAGAIEVASSQ